VLWHHPAVFVEEAVGKRAPKDIMFLYQREANPEAIHKGMWMF